MEFVGREGTKSSLTPGGRLGAGTAKEAPINTVFTWAGMSSGTSAE